METLPEQSTEIRQTQPLFIAIEQSMRVRYVHSDGQHTIVRKYELTDRTREYHFDEDPIQGQPINDSATVHLQMCSRVA